MGRPIKKRFFGSTISPYRNFATGGKTGVGAEGVASVTISNSGTNNYSQGVTVAFGAPNITGGIQATGTPIVGTNGNAGKIMGFNITNAGSGYTSGPSITLTTATGVTSAATGTISVAQVYPATTVGIQIGMQVFGVNINASATYVTSVVGNVVNLTWANSGTVNTSVIFRDMGTGFTSSAVNLTSGRQNTIAFASKLVGGSVRTTGDILKQEGSHRYLIQNTDGKGICKLVAKANVSLLAGEMNIIATDANSNTYYVTKLTARKARVVRLTQSGSNAWLVTDGGQAGWNVTSATGNIVSIAHTI